MRKGNSLVLDIGTTGVKAFIFDQNFKLIAKEYEHLEKAFPKRGWVEQDPKELIKKSVLVLKQAAFNSRVPLLSISGLGITNQRETTILWDTRTSRAVYPAIVWEDVRTARRTAKLVSEKRDIRSRTGLTPDPYFSATKIEWILNNVPRAKRLLEQGRLRFGTVDSWVLWNISQEQTHTTDYTNASRTLLFNIKTLSWDPKLTELFSIPKEMLPAVQSSSSHFGTLRSEIVGAPLPIRAVCGDQQSSMSAVGTAPGKTKITFGTGTFLVQAIGDSFKVKEPFFTTLIPHQPKPRYALEYKIDCCGAKIDELLAAGRNLDPTLDELAHTLEPLVKVLPHKPKEIVVDGGVTQAKNLTAIMSEVLGVPVRKQSVFDGTALGVAKLIQS